MPFDMALSVHLSRAHKKRQQRRWNSLTYCIQPLCTVKCPMIGTAPSRSPSRATTTSYLRPSVDVIYIAVRTLGNDLAQQIVVRFTTTYDLPRSLTVNNDCSAAASSLVHLEANHAPRVTSPIAHATCRNPDHIKTCIPVRWPPVKRKHHTRTCSVYI